MLPSAAALVLAAAQSAACIEAPSAGAALAEQAEICLETLFASGETLAREQPLPVGERCPALGSSLANAPLPDVWIESFRDQATTAQLQDLSALLRSNETRPAAIRFEPDFALLETVLAETLEDEPRKAWLDRFLRWLEEKLEKHRTSQIGRLFERLADVLPPAWVVEAIVKGALALILLLAVLIVLNVLRDEGVRDWWRTLFARTGGRADRPGPAGPQVSSWSEVTSLPSALQVSALVRYVIQVLSGRGLLAPDRSRTNRELGRQLTRRHRVTGDLFCQFTGRAEPFVYGARSPNSLELQSLRQDARRLTTSKAPTTPAVEASPS